jgi:hypothetical protein
VLAVKGPVCLRRLDKGNPVKSNGLDRYSLSEHTFFLPLQPGFDLIQCNVRLDVGFGI